MKNRKKVYQLCFCATMVALAVILSFIKLWHMPLGGSVTLCDMLPILLIGYFLGAKWGVVCAFSFSLVLMFLNIGNVMAWGISAPVLIACVFLDYLVPYTLLGLCGVFAPKRRRLDASHPYSFRTFFAGMAFVILLRFVCHFLSGVVLFSEWALFEPSWLYSICYNAAYLLPDLILCMLAGALVFRPLCRIAVKYI